MSHLTFLPSDLSELSVLSCRVITIRGFVLIVFFLTDFHHVNSVVSLGSVLLSFFGQNGHFYISEKYFGSNRKFENSKFLNNPTLFFITNLMLTSLTSIFACVGGFDCANPGEWQT